MMIVVAVGLYVLMTMQTSGGSEKSVGDIYVSLFYTSHALGFATGLFYIFPRPLFFLIILCFIVFEGMTDNIGDILVAAVVHSIAFYFHFSALKTDPGKVPKSANEAIVLYSSLSFPIFFINFDVGALRGHE